MLYHFSIGFPENVIKISGIFKLIFTYHAIKASGNDRYGKIQLPTVLNVDSALLVEMEVVDGIMIKGVYRVPYDNQCDLIIVMLANGKVKTVWLNYNSDKHYTLDKSKYQTI